MTSSHPPKKGDRKESGKIHVEERKIRSFDEETGAYVDMTVFDDGTIVVTGEGKKQ